MALPEGLVTVGEDYGKPFITISDRLITFSKMAIEQLQYTPYVHMMINENTHVVVFQACEKDGSAIPFYKEPDKGKQLLVRISSKKYASLILNMTSSGLVGNTMRIYGDFLPEDKAIVFYL